MYLLFLFRELSSRLYNRLSLSRCLPWAIPMASYKPHIQCRGESKLKKGEHEPEQT